MANECLVGNHDDFRLCFDRNKINTTSLNQAGAGGGEARPVQPRASGATERDYKLEKTDQSQAVIFYLRIWL